MAVWSTNGAGGTAVMDIVTLCLCIVGMALLALGTEQQQGVLLSHALPAGFRRMLQCMGAFIVLQVLLQQGLWHGWPLGLVYFSGQTSVAAGAVYLMLIAARGRKSRARSRHCAPRTFRI